jgi:hypothetical protein
MSASGTSASGTSASHTHRATPGRLRTQCPLCCPTSLASSIPIHHPGLYLPHRLFNDNRIRQSHQQMGRMILDRNRRRHLYKTASYAHCIGLLTEPAGLIQSARIIHWLLNLSRPTEVQYIEKGLVIWHSGVSLPIHVGQANSIFTLGGRRVPPLYAGCTLSAAGPSALPGPTRLLCCPTSTPLQIFSLAESINLINIACRYINWDYPPFTLISCIKDIKLPLINAHVILPHEAVFMGSCKLIRPGARHLYTITIEIPHAIAPCLFFIGASTSFTSPRLATV